MSFQKMVLWSMSECLRTAQKEGEDDVEVVD